MTKWNQLSSAIVLPNLSAGTGRWFHVWWTVWQLSHTLLSFFFWCVYVLKFKGSHPPSSWRLDSGATRRMSLSDVKLKQESMFWQYRTVLWSESWMSVSGSHTWLFVKQTLAYLPVADRTFVFCLFFLDILSSAMVDVMLHITLLFIC